MITRQKPEKFRLRRTMMFMNAQKPGLIKDAYIWGSDSIEALQEKAYSLVGEPAKLEWEDEVVAIVEARDGTILDVVRTIKPLQLD